MVTDATRAQMVTGVVKKARHRDAGNATRMVTIADATRLVMSATSAPATTEMQRMGVSTGIYTTSGAPTAVSAQGPGWATPNDRSVLSTTSQPSTNPLLLPVPSAAQGAPSAAQGAPSATSVMASGAPEPSPGSATRGQQPGVSNQRTAGADFDEDLLLQDSDPLLSSTAQFSEDPY